MTCKHDTIPGRLTARRAWVALMAGMLLTAAGTAAAASSDNMPEASKYTNVTWYQVVNVNYRPGKADEARSIIKKYFIPAARKAGVPGPAMVLIHQTGQWDETILWKLKDGPSMMEWKMSPQSAKWFKAMADLNGGAKKAHQIWSRYMSYVESESATLEMADPSLSGS